MRNAILTDFYSLAPVTNADIGCSLNLWMPAGANSVVSDDLGAPSATGDPATPLKDLRKGCHELTSQIKV